jgi:uncharacterized membrane protein
MPAPVRPENPFAPAIGGKFLARAYWVSTFLLAAAFLSALVAVITGADTNMPEAWLLLFAAFNTLAALARQLPAQNVLLAALITAFIGGAAHSVGAKSGIPFGPFMFGSETGMKLFDTLPWIMPVLWVVAVLNSRGVARLVLRPWRKVRAYGFWLMGLTALFTMLFDCALEPFAAHAKHYWIWTAGDFSLTFQGAPVSNLVGWFLVTMLILAFATPALINKQLSKRSTPDFHPLIVWLGANLLFGAASILHGFWTAAAMDAAVCVITVVCASRGAKW